MGAAITPMAGAIIGATMMGAGTVRTAIRAPPREVIMVYPSPPPRVIYAQPSPRVVFMDPAPVQAIPMSPPYTDNQGRYCREYQSTLIVGGMSQPGYGTACLQPDGSWRIVR